MCIPRVWNLGNALLTSRNPPKYFYQCNINNDWFKRWKTSLGTTNIFSRLYLKLLAYCSVRNFRYKQEKNVSCSRGLFHVSNHYWWYEIQLTMFRAPAIPDLNRISCPKKVGTSLHVPIPSGDPVLSPLTQTSPLLLTLPRMTMILNLCDTLSLQLL